MSVTAVLFSPTLKLSAPLPSLVIVGASLTSVTVTGRAWTSVRSVGRTLSLTVTSTA